MNVDELVKKLEELGVQENEYSIKTDAITIESFHGLWQSYYTDIRGERSMERTFSSESEACQYLYELFLRKAKYAPFVKRFSS